MDKTYQDIHITNGKDTDVIRKVRILGMICNEKWMNIFAIDDDRKKEIHISVPKLPKVKIIID